MTSSDIDVMCRRHLDLKLDKEERRKFNKGVNLLKMDILARHREDMKKKGGGGGVQTTADLKKYLDDPMTDDERARYVRAAMDVELSKGASIQDLERVAKTFGLGKSEDTSIAVVDFGTAFKDLAEAVAVCHNGGKDGQTATA